MASSLAEKERLRRYYVANKEAIIARQLVTQRARRARIKEWFKALKESAPCADCHKQFPPCVMEFHHERDKLVDVSRAALNNWSQKRVEAEIEKCVLLCANCHRMRTCGRNELAL